jgi:hypothetical protein
MKKIGLAIAAAMLLAMPAAANAAVVSYSLGATPDPLIEGLIGPQWEGSGSIALEMGTDGTFTQGLGISSLTFQATDRRPASPTTYFYHKSNINTLLTTKFTVSGGELVSLHLNLSMPPNLFLCETGCVSFHWDPTGSAVEKRFFGLLLGVVSQEAPDGFLFAVTSVSQVPLPAGLPLLLTSIGGLVLLRRRRKA